MRVYITPITLPFLDPTYSQSARTSEQGANVSIPLHVTVRASPSPFAYYHPPTTIYTHPSFFKHHLLRF